MKMHLVPMLTQHLEHRHSAHSPPSTFSVLSVVAKKDKYTEIPKYNSAEKKKKATALTGNRTRASRVAGENSTTEPSVPYVQNLYINLYMPAHYKIAVGSQASNYHKIIYIKHPREIQYLLAYISPSLYPLAE